MEYSSHNPYFNRWFSAIRSRIHKCDTVRGHNPYFNRWFSAIIKRTKPFPSVDEVTILILIDGFLQLRKLTVMLRNMKGHNPYFNRWFSAIYYES